MLGLGGGFWFCALLLPRRPRVSLVPRRSFCVVCSVFTLFFDASNDAYGIH